MNSANILNNFTSLFNLQMANVIFHQAMNAISSLRIFIANDLFGTAAFFSNNNDNNNNNNINNNNINENQRLRITRLRISLNQFGMRGIRYTRIVRANTR